MNQRNKYTNKAKRPIKGKESNESLVRLNKYISDSGYTSRRKADELITSGSVAVNGKIVTELGTRVKPNDNVTIEGNTLKIRSRFQYILLNKPKDYITTTSDELNRKTVMDLLPVRQRLYPVGRLDRNTTGCLLITNDGELANRLMHPKWDIERVYNVTTDKELRPEDASRISRGVDLGDESTRPCEIFINPDDHYKSTIILKEGKNREVRRIFEEFGYNVRKLDRKYYANLSTSGLKRGEFRHLTKKEVSAIRKMVGLV